MANYSRAFSPMLGVAASAFSAPLLNHLLRSLASIMFTGAQHTAKFISRMIF